MDARLSDEAVQNLVTQFSSALDFYRELVQNSIDAGSSSIEVWTQFEQGSADEGTISIHVDDFGEGMNEEIIDDQLTRLFSSSKENDLTKIGKFGIGFVSVFALQPKGVLVHTGRDGEYWEVFFFEDRSFTKTRIDTPVEGTQITLFVAGDVTRYRDLVEGSRATLERWCSHSDTEVTFEDRSPIDGRPSSPELVNKPFEVEGDAMVSAKHPGTELVLAYTRTPVYGFYNKGLALAVTRTGDDVMGGRAERYRHIAFKIKSRYLEHTLSRETVMRDDNYDKAMALLDAAADRTLRPRLVDQLEALASLPRWGLRETADYERQLGFLALEPGAALLEIADRPILRTVGGVAATLDDALEAVERDGRVFVAAASSRLTAALHEQDVPVFLGSASAQRSSDVVGPAALVIRRFLAGHTRASAIGFVRRKFFKADLDQEAADRITHPEDVLVSVDPDPDPTPEARALLGRASELLAKVGAGYRELRCGRIDTRPDQPVLFVIGRKITSVMAFPPEGGYERGFLQRPAALVDRHHADFCRLLNMFAATPDLAAYCLAKSLLLTEDILLERDAELCRHATEHLRAIT